MKTNFVPSVKRGNPPHRITHEEINHWFRVWGIIGKLRFNVTADLNAQGKLDAAESIVFCVPADLKAEGKLNTIIRSKPSKYLQHFYKRR